MHRCSFCEWIPILPLPVWPLAGQVLLGQHVVVGSMTLLLAVRGNIATRSMSGPPFALQLHRTTVWCGATLFEPLKNNGLFCCPANPFLDAWFWSTDRCAHQAISAGIYNHLLFIDIDAFREKRAHPEHTPHLQARGKRRPG